MKGYRFYAELPEHRGSKSGSKQHLPFTRRYLEGLAAGNYHHNVVAIPLNEKGQPLWHVGEPVMDSFAGLNDRANAPVCSTSTSRDYLRTRCVRIDAALAKKLHPNLFHYLENP